MILFWYIFFYILWYLSGVIFWFFSLYLRICFSIFFEKKKIINDFFEIFSGMFFYKYFFFDVFLDTFLDGWIAKCHTSEQRAAIVLPWCLHTMKSDFCYCPFEPLPSFWPCFALYWLQKKYLSSEFRIIFLKRQHYIRFSITYTWHNGCQTPVIQNSRQLHAHINTLIRDPMIFQKNIRSFTDRLVLLLVLHRRQKHIVRQRHLTWKIVIL